MNFTYSIRRRPYSTATFCPDGDEGDGERDVDGEHGGDRRGEDPDYLPLEGGAAQAKGGGIGVELSGGGLDERGDEVLGAGAEAAAAAQVGERETDLVPGGAPPHRPSP
uniref:DUF834 domain-containing protein n=1 Tax=Oryza sativa subsp. japonica TaxID=39947 RepID=Q5W734_ORYSJ|nr:hypothetical protein [Oryza sativa Japonica Group]